MTIEELKQILKAGGAALRLDIGDKAISLFLNYLEELTEWNKKINLTSVTGDRDIIIRHFLDSLILTPLLVNQKNLLDIGSGAGFPGIPLKIILPDLKVTLMDSINKKVVFMRHIIRTLGLKNIEAIQARAEDKETIRKFVACFDVVTSRAFAELGKFLESASPYAKKGGMLLALKGPKGSEEVKALKQLNDIEYIEAREVRLPFSDVTTTILVFRKIAD
jgi:16S rRNA (guanine527-N7)-methyltransferase